jgi:hypothetical protein
MKISTGAMYREKIPNTASRIFLPRGLRSGGMVPINIPRSLLPISLTELD